MTKFRSKLKKKVGTKQVAKGQSSVSNPVVTKHRAKAKSRFFQSNLLIASSANSNNGLTMEAVEQHDAIESFKKPDPVHSIAGSMKDIRIGDDDAFSQSQRSVSQATTFATQFSACSNMSFSKLINNFRTDSQVQKEMLAILAALTEIIKEKGGTESSTEYFLALMETIENVKEDCDIQAAVMLLNMGIKSVPEAVLRKKFNETASVFLDLIARFVDSPDKNLLRTIISCLSVVLRAQEYSQWKLSSTMKFFDAILSFSIHSKPKIRKAAQHAITSVLFGSCFMMPPKKEGEESDEEEMKAEPPKIVHPASSRVSKFCVDQFKPEIINNNQTLLLHVLGLLQTVLGGFGKDDIKVISEHLLSIMTSGNMMIRTNCFQTFHALFSSKSHNLTSQLVGRLVSALYEYRPDRTDFRQVLAWIMVMKQAHIKLVQLSQQVCIQALPRFFETCINDLWLSDKVEVVSGTSNALKEILEECVKPVCAVEDQPLPEYRLSIKKIIKTLTKALAAPFGATSSHILVICGVAFESLGKHFGEDLEEAVTMLGMRYDEQSAHRVHIEHAVLAAVSSMDTEKFLSCIPLIEANGSISVKRSWILPLLREGLQNASLEFFNRHIIKLAFQCYTKWQAFKEKDKKMEAHVFELLCCQLWGLFPGFCRNPRDLHNFKLIAKTLGTVLNENPDLRPPVLDGFKELLSNLQTDEDKEVFGKYAQNYMTRFFNIYTTKPTTTYENEVRQSAFEVAKLYMAVTPKSVLNTLFESAIDQMNSKAPGSFMYDMLFDIVEAMTLFQSYDKIKELFQNYIVGTLIKDKSEKKKESEEKGEKLKDQSLRRRLKKAYKLLQDIMISENEGCAEFVATELDNIEKILTSSTYKVMEGTQVMRLACFNQVLEKKASLDIKNKIVKISISEVLASFNNEAVMKDGIAYNLLRSVGRLYEEADKLNEFVDAVMAGLVGDNQLISNTITALKFIVQEFAQNLSIDTLKFILEQVLEFVVSNQRNEVTASLTFLVIFVKILPSPFVATHLRIMMKAINLMIPDTRRHCRLIMAYLLKKLCKKFTAEEITKMVPGSDETLHKKLKNIRKEMNRTKKNRLENSKRKSKGGDDDDSDDDELMNLEKKSMTIDDILADSDSDLSDGDDDKKKPKQKSKGQDTYIRETEDSIVDLADPDAFSKITTSKPPPSNLKDSKFKSKESNRGFQTAPDGRLIIEDIEDQDTDSDDDDMTGYKDKAKAKVYDDAESDEEKNGPSKKRIALNGYQTGGSGIHRPLAASVKSGMSSHSKTSKKSTSSRRPGSEYKASKAGGDIKHKGKHEPYAYVALSRNSLNRRKRGKSGNQFNSITKKPKGKKRKA